MRVLLDECLPRRLKAHLAGHQAITVPEAGWAGKKNGDLLRAASTSDPPHRVPASPLLLGLLSAALFGLATPASKALLQELSAPQLAGLLYLGAALGVAPVALRSSWGRPRDNTARGWSVIGAAVLVGGGLGPLLLLAGLAISRAADASLVLNLELAATAALGHVFFREHLDPKGFLAVAGITAAGAIVSYNTGLPGLLGGGLVALACVCWALDNHWTAIVDAFSPAQTTLVKGLFAGSANFLVGLLLAPFTASATAILAALVVGAFSYGVSITLYVHAAQRLGPARAQGVFATAPFVGAALSFLLLHEPLSWLHLVGAALLVLCIVLLMRVQHSHSHTHEAMWHNHPHSHDDGHHDHGHPSESAPAGAVHTHWHRHKPVTHAHPHVPDLHHRHDHSK